MDQPRKIMFFHQQTGEYIGTLNNRGEYRFWDDVHEQDMDGTNFFNFMMPNTIDFAERVVGRVRVMIPHEETGWQEFIIHSVEDDGTMREVRTNGAETDLNKLKIVEPGNAQSLTAYQYVELCTENTVFQPGIIEFSGSRTIDRSRPRGAYDYLGMVCTEFNLEMRIRTETNGGRITRRLVDLLERVGSDRAQTVEYGKDLVAFRKLVDSNGIVTSLYCQTPEREDGTRIYATVTHAEAFQQWNWQGTHLTGIYEPESDNQDMTVEQLRQYGQTALNKLVASVFEYDVEAISVEYLFPHKRVRLGDRINVKNTDIKPAIYSRARVLRVIRSISNETSKRYVIGEIKEIPAEDALRTFRSLQAKYGARIIRSDAPPASTANTNWIDTSGPIDIGKTFNVNTQTWEKHSPTEPLEIGAVDSNDYNGRTIATLLNAPDNDVQLIARTLNLVGAVNVLSDITGNLGTISTGKINLLQMAGTDEKIMFGENTNNPDGTIDYAEDSMRFQSDSSTYLKVNRGGASGFGASNVSSAAIIQLYGAGAPMFNFGFLEQEFKHRTIQAGNVRLKFLNGDITALQVRTENDAALAPIHASELVTQSVRELKRNITPYAKNATDEIMTTPVHSYKFLDDTENDLERMGLIYDEAPADIVNVSGFGIDVYSMASMLWKGFQEQQNEINTMKQQMQEIQQAIADIQAKGATDNV